MGEDRPLRGRVCRGISDMMFLDDGSLLVAANSPKGAPPDGGGALFRAAVWVGQGPVALLERFAGLKPEGVALAPGEGGVLVVFDTDGELPRWTELPLPLFPPPGPALHPGPSSPGPR